ncbi:class I SAM-dependent methyltransferase [Campylobacter concisus]|uniref:Class I SAM-dependent methyltransferase n=1 Tax=Campylobacter concisus TaxID=199 RepID=A0AAE7P2N5_9BACT|nr:class I SAM-dependent methyltransferase [Campylobacter concisus]QPH85593.1 class I SAM-dependent methyltransferase [Campylobacter concisus]
MNCKICNGPTKKFDNGFILNKYYIDYFQCEKCGFVQTESPYWLKESYSDAISVSDTGVMSRNIIFSKLATIMMSLCVNTKRDFLDYGGGYGIFTRIMRDNGFNFYWYDKYAINLVARGFEGSISEKKYEAITSFENFEHFENPIEEIEKIFSLTDFVLFSTELITVPAPSTNNWWYYCLEHGQHISIFSNKTLEYIAKKYGYNLISNGRNLHIFSKKKLNNRIFLLEKIIRKLKLENFFKKKPKTDSDMNMMIEKMKMV